MRTILHMITRNEAYRYLDATLAHNLPFFDDAFVLDDGSTDDTIEILKAHQVSHCSRPDFCPSYMEDETVLRYFAWVMMFESLDIEEGDWIVSLDADELIQGDLARTITILHAGGFLGSEVQRHNLWHLNPPMKRVDGLWDTIKPVRFCAATEAPQEFGINRRLPDYAFGEACFAGELPVRVLHYGYIDEIDRYTRYERFIRKYGAPNSHIMSLLEQPECIIMEDVPTLWTGIK